MKPQKVVNKGVRELAREAGVSPALVSRKLRAGKSPRQIMLEAEARRQQQAAPSTPASPPSTPAIVTTKSRSMIDGTFAEAQLRKESALADLRELELAEKRRDLLSASEVSTAIHELIATSKSKLLLIGDELGDRISAESDPIKCREMIAAEIRAALQELSKYQAA